MPEDEEKCTLKDCTSRKDLTCVVNRPKQIVLACEEKEVDAVETSCFGYFRTFKKKKVVECSLPNTEQDKKVYKYRFTKEIWSSSKKMFTRK